MRITGERTVSRGGEKTVFINEVETVKLVVIVPLVQSNFLGSYYEDGLGTKLHTCFVAGFVLFYI